MGHHKGGNLYGISWLDAMVLPVYDFIDNTWGHNVPAWRWGHHVLHHMHTNDAKFDNDAPGAHPILRIFGNQKRLPFHRAQSVYWLLVLPFTTFQYPFESLFVYGGSLMSFVLYWLVLWVIPCYFHGMAGLCAAAVAQ